MPFHSRSIRGAIAVVKPTSAIAPDCRHYKGDRPCIHNRLCNGCEHYAPYGSRIAIIKLGALGDVIRTLCILPALREQFPGAHITWVSLPNGCRMIAGHPLIDRVLPFDPVNAMVLSQESFDLVVSLDKEPQPCALAMTLMAKRKVGVGLSDFGTPVPLNTQAEPYFHLGLSDELKFTVNNKSYLELVHEALGLRYRGRRYELPVNDTARDRVLMRLANLGWRPTAPTIGVNVGSGKAFANKMWPAEMIVQTIAHLRAMRSEAQVVLLGGPDERPIVNAVLDGLRDAGIDGGVFDPGTEHDEPSFVALVDVCDVVFSGDTMAMHVAIARGKGTVVFFGPTCEQEIDLFGRGEKLIARVPCGPCYKRVCEKDDACTKQIEPSAAAEAIARVLDQAKSDSIPLPVLDPAALQKAG